MTASLAADVLTARSISRVFRRNLAIYKPHNFTKFVVFPLANTFEFQFLKTIFLWS